MKQPPRSSRTAFTLLELLVVVLILAILAAITIPRMVGHEQRTFQLAADEGADLLTMYAQREAMSPKPVGIWHDGARNWIALVVLDFDPARPDEAPDWRIDPFAKPVKLPDNVHQDGVSARADGEFIDFRRWPVASNPGNPRPGIEIALRADDGTVKTIVLPAHGIAPYRLEGFRDGVRVAIDLDAEGRDREDW